MLCSVERPAVGIIFKNKINILDVMILSILVLGVLRR